MGDEERGGAEGVEPGRALTGGCIDLEDNTRAGSNQVLVFNLQV
jgi:hypothetical protein